LGVIARLDARYKRRSLVSVAGLGFDEKTDFTSYGEFIDDSTSLDFEVQLMRTTGVLLPDVVESLEFG
jgi:uncharacterized protein YhjY with autotransporter beta-barrel domain